MPLTAYPNGLSSFGFPLLGSGPFITTGKVFFVNSATGIDARSGNQGRGTSPDKPFSTVAYAITECGNGTGDIIFVMPGHTESISAAGSWAITSKNGLSIIGIGNRSARPVITFNTVVGAQITCSSAGVTLQNMHFDLTGINAVAAAFAITGSNFQCIDCKVVQAVAAARATKCFLIGGSAARFIRLEVDATNSAGAASAIETSAPVTDVQLFDCIIRGNYSVAPLVSSGTNHFVYFFADGIHLHQLNGTAKAVISVTTASTGTVRRSSLKGTTWTTAADGISTGSIFLFIDTFGGDDGTNGNGILVPAAGTIS